jgi:hypothetical protein
MQETLENIWTTFHPRKTQHIKNVRSSKTIVFREIYSSNVYVGKQDLKLIMWAFTYK